MRRISIALENCYGIKDIKAEFDFSQRRVCAIYAPNGAMKTSFAKTFQDIANNTASMDRVFPTRTSKREVRDDAGVDLQPESILVVRPYDEVFGHSEKTSTLLVNPSLRKEYEQLHVDIEAAKDILIKALKAQSKSKKDIEREISSTFTKSGSDLYVALTRVFDEISRQKDAPFSNVEYDTIFDDKVISFLGGKDVKSTLEAYIKKYNELIAKSTYFKKGVFNYYNASTIAKNLADNGFFKAKHSLNLNADTRVEISDEKALESLITAEKEAISSDATLRKQFSSLEKQIQKNANVRGLEAYLSTNEELLPHLTNIDQFKEDVWKSYIHAHFELYEDVVEKYKKAETRRAEIEAQAAKERTQWEDVIDIFNDRFFVPFKLVAQNRTSVILGQEPILSLGFTFEDGLDSAPVDRSSLLEVLSTGEKKALYVLNIIFEIEARRKSSVKTVLVVDDIADSFDYKNKYAIIQYLNDISDDSSFCQIILTHNFDFFRTINSRFVPYDQCYMASKSSSGITLSKASGIQNVFINDWKRHFATDPKKRLASIPFLRNLVEFTRGEADSDYLLLTSLLHWKADSASIKEDDLFRIYNTLFGASIPVGAGQDVVVDLVNRHANDCLAAAAGVNFENKVVLSIAIRLQAERFMVDNIADPTFVASITSKQTARLLNEFARRCSAKVDAIRTIKKVILMTPENIHLNSFMYEPIIDMSDEHLRRLFQEVNALV